MPLDLTPYHGPPAFLPVLTGNPSVLVVGRSSVPAGREAYRVSVQDLLQAANLLESSTGLQIMSAIPTKTDLEAMLRESPAVTSVTPENRKFTNRYLQWSNPELGIHLLVSAGSGRKVDESLLQPALTRTAEIFRTLRPGLLFAKRLDRIGRRAWGFGPLMELVEQTGSWVGDEEGLRAPDEWSNLRVFMDASRGQKVAEGLPVMTRRGMASKTGSVMVNGRVAYHVAQPPPPGTTRLGMLSHGGGLGDTLLVLDSPKYLPDDAAVATGMPQVYDSSRRHVDQVANVRWALSVLGRPEWSRRAVVTELARRQMSTYSLRGNNGSDATVQPPSATATVFPVLNSILNNLELYESGRLHLRLGVEDVADLVIDGVIPDDGPWATPEDFARIRRMQQNGQERHDRHRSLSLSSLRATLAGQPARLITAAGRRPQHPGYVISLWERPKGRQPRATREPVIPHQALADSLVHALQQAGEVPFTLWQPPGLDDRNLTATITRLEMAVEAIETSRRAIRMQVTAVDESGAPRLSGALLDDLNAEYQRLTARELPDAQRQLEEVKKELEDRRLAHATESGAAQAADLLRLVAALRDPHDLSLAALWRQSIRDLKFEVHQESEAKHTTDVVMWTGSIVFSDLSDRYAITFHGSHRSGAGSKIDERVIRAVTSMLEGVPFDLCDTERKPVLKSKVAEQFGIPVTQFMLGSCLDPRITRTAAWLLHQPNLTDSELAEALQETVAFVERIRHVYRDTPRKRAVWLRHQYTVVARWHVVAAANSGVVAPTSLLPHVTSANSAISTLTASIHADQWTRADDGPYRLTRCPHCGGHRRAPMRIEEPVGLVCLDCRKDQAGLDWPADPYDQWRCATDLWREPE